MTRVSALRSGRRRGAHRRLFFFAWLVALLAAGMLRPADACGQGDPETRILRRQARITRDQSGRYRIIESLLVTVGDGAARAGPGGPLRLVQLNAADEVRGLGGDFGPQQVVYDPPYLTIVGAIGPGEFQVVFTYVVPEGTMAVDMAAAAPLDEFILEIQRGGVTAHPDPQFRPNGEGGPEARPYRRYVAQQLPVGRALTVEFIERRVDWRQRLAVFFGTAFAIVAAMVWVWRREAAGWLAARSAG